MAINRVVNEFSKIKKAMIIGSFALGLATVAFSFKYGYKKNIENQVMNFSCFSDTVDVGFFNHNKGLTIMSRQLVKKPRVPLKETDDKSLVFIHIPKNAGSSVEKTFNVYSMLGTIKLFDKKKSCYTFAHGHHITPQQSIDHNLETRDFFERNIAFAIVRNPYARVISTYTFLKERGVISQRTTLDSFIDICELIQREVDRQNTIPYIFAQLPVGQSKFIYFNDGNSTVKEILHFESLASDWKKLAEKYPEFEIPKVLLHENSTSVKSKEKITLTEAQKERVYDIYREDFENFGYAK